MMMARSGNLLLHLPHVESWRLSSRIQRSSRQASTPNPAPRSTGTSRPWKGRMVLPQVHLLVSRIDRMPLLKLLPRRTRHPLRKHVPVDNYRVCRPIGPRDARTLEHQHCYRYNRVCLTARDDLCIRTIEHRHNQVCLRIGPRRDPRTSQSSMTTSNHGLGVPDTGRQRRGTLGSTTCSRRNVHQSCPQQRWT